LSECEGEVIYTASGTQGGNIITVTNSNNFLNGANSSGLLLQIETDPGKQIYEVVSVLNSNTFTVKPALTTTFSNQALYVAQLLKWPDASGNREHMGFWPVADTYTPSIYMLDGNSGRTYLNGDIYHYGNGKFYFTGLNTSNKLLLNGGAGGPVVVRELIIGNTALTDAQRIEIEGYLAWKWGSDAKLPLQHPYATAPAQAAWSPAQLGNLLELWLDANQSNSLFADTACSIPAAYGSTVDCWRDLSPHQRHFYIEGENHHTYKLHEDKPSVEIFGSNLTHNNPTWMNNQNLFIAIVLDRKPYPGLRRGAEGGPLRIHGGFAFPFPYNACIGGSSGYTNVSSGYTQYSSQRSTLVLQGNARNQPFYQPYFNRAMKSSLTTRSPPKYLHEQPYLLAIVAKFLILTPPSTYSTLLGTVIPLGISNKGIYRNRYLGIGLQNGNHLFLDQGWNNWMHTYTSGTGSLEEPDVYFFWRKGSAANENPSITLNGMPIEPRRSESYSGFIRVIEDPLTMLSLGDYTWTANGRTFSGSIYEAMVLTGPNIKYGHQRLIEGYLAWKWGLQHKLPRRHSYRRVPPAR
jgi:hypothetical protein